MKSASGTDWIVMALFIIVFGGVIVFALVKMIQSALVWLKNSRSPVLTENVKAVDKREKLSRQRQRVAGGVSIRTTTMIYYVTFEFEDGRRVEMVVPANDYGYIAEGDTGRLTYQGTWYKGFEKI
jgi:hypothetical protein